MTATWHLDRYLSATLVLIIMMCDVFVVAKDYTAWLFEVFCHTIASILLRLHSTVFFAEPPPEISKCRKVNIG